MILYFLSGMFAYAVLGHISMEFLGDDEPDRRYSHERNHPMDDARDVCQCAIEREIEIGFKGERFEKY